jgi:hypothetical protein
MSPMITGLFRKKPPEDAGTYRSDGGDVGFELVPR